MFHLLMAFTFFHASAFIVLPSTSRECNCPSSPPCPASQACPSSLCPSNEPFVFNRINNPTNNQPDALQLEDDAELISSERQRNVVKRRATVGATTPHSEETDDTEQFKPSVDLKCNSEILKGLMLESITNTTSDSKRKINEEAEDKFGGSIDVICSKGHFSYVYSSNLYCEATKNDITCIAFRQTLS